MNKVSFLKALLRAAKSKAWTWSMPDADHYVAETSAGELSIKFQTVLLANKSKAVNEVAVVNAGGIIHTIFSGSEGMELVLKILSVASPMFAAHQKLIQRRMKSMVLALQKDTQKPKPKA